MQKRVGNVEEILSYKTEMESNGDIQSFLGTTMLWTVLVLLICGALQYAWILYEDKYAIQPSNYKEGFVDTGAVTESEHTRITWFENDELFDEFYASVYDNLTQLASRYPQEISLILQQWKKKADPATMEILDCGCGTGMATIFFAKQNVKSIVGLDSSRSMIRRAKTVTVVAANITREQRDSIQFIDGDMHVESTFSGGQFSHAAILFFTIYYSSDPVGLFKNLFFWLRPGGSLAVEVVNKYKFDPILEAASPFSGVSLQKYSKKRITKSKVEFDTFSYEAEFDLQDPAAEFREVFRFKDKSVRRQRHTMNMRDINSFIDLAVSTGWKYVGFVDLLTAGFEYAYVLIFSHP